MNKFITEVNKAIVFAFVRLCRVKTPKLLQKTEIKTTPNKGVKSNYNNNIKKKKNNFLMSF